MALQARWVEVASDHYFALTPQDQLAVNDAVRRLLDDPDGPASSYDVGTDHWTTTAGDGRVLIIYIFRPTRPWLVILRLVVI